MIELKCFYGKKVNILGTSGNTFAGIVEDYIYPEDNETGNESIILKTETVSIEFENNDIVKIEVVE